MPRLRPRVILNPSDLPISARSLDQAIDSPLSDPATPAAPAPTAGQTSYFGRLVAYIPAEIIAFYQAFAGPIADPLARPAGQSASAGTAAATAGATLGQRITDPALLWLGIGLLILTPIWIYWTTKDNEEPPAYHQVLIATLAFFVWLLAVSNPIVDVVPGWEPIYGSLAMAAAVAFAFPLIEIGFRQK